MISDLGLVHASYGLPEWQAVKVTFFCTLCIPVLYIDLSSTKFLVQYKVDLHERLCCKENGRESGALNL